MVRSATRAEQGINILADDLQNAIILNDSMPEDCLEKVLKRRTHEVLHQKARPEAKSTPMVGLRANWQREPMNTGET